MKRFNEKISRKNTSCVKWDMVDDNVLSFSIADSDYPTSEEIVKCLTDRVNHPVYGYTFPDPMYYESIINWTKRRYGYEITKSNIIPTNGVVTSLYYAINFLKDKTEGIIVQTPVYNPFYSVIQDNGKKIVENKLIKNDNFYTMNLQELDRQLETNKILILCNPQNPTGRVFTYDEIEKVVRLAKKHNAYILSDEIHCDVILEGHKFTSVNKFASEYENMIVFTSISKSFGLAGLKTSNVVIKNEKLADEFRTFLATKYIGSGNIFGLVAVKAAYNHSEAWLDKQNKHLTNNFKLLKKYLNEKHPEVGVTKTEGTFLAWLDLSFLGMPCEVMQQELLKFGISINEGKRYSEDCKGYIRFNFACSEEQMLAGLEILSKFINANTK